MDAAQIRQFSQTAAGQRSALFGVDLTFRGETVRGVLTPGDPNVTLGLGGLRESGSFRVRLPISITPPPKIKELIIEVATGRTFYVTGCIVANPENPLAKEHLVGAQLA